MRYQKKILLPLLQLSKRCEIVALDQLVEKTKLPQTDIEEYIHEELSNIAKINGTQIYLNKNNKMSLVEKAILSGLPLKTIIESLHWREFETFCLVVFEYHNFKTIQNFHYSYKKKRYEIDVIAMQAPLIFAIDAKHWKSGHSSILKKMVKNQVERVKILGKALRQDEFRRKLPLHGWYNAKLIPMIVTSKTYEITIYQKVPIIPFFKLNQFITDYHSYSELILHLPTHFSFHSNPSSKTILTYFTKSP
ncbi:MAG: restriction endonuclease [Candidatus Helarchaeota archaeon]